jgi:PDZ domain-containing protein
MAAGWLNGADDVESEKVIRGPIPPQQYEQLNRDLMSDSKRAAEVVALSRLGYRVAQGALIVSVDPSFPGASSLHDNDVVTKVDGKAVSTADDLVAAVRGRHPGDHARLEVKRDKAARDVDVTIGGDAGHPMLGVRVSTDVEPPFDVAIDSGNVVGPSAGLAFALELYDQLTPGELTGGRKVAATGELGLDGKVDAVGGVTQKTISVRRAGADVFLVPRDNYAEARAHAGKHLKVYAIDDFDTALRVLNGSK